MILGCGNQKVVLFALHKTAAQESKEPAIQNAGVQPASHPVTDFFWGLCKGREALPTSSLRDLCQQRALRAPFVSDIRLGFCNEFDTGFAL